MKKIIKQENILLLISIIFGLISIYFFGDKKLDNEWFRMVENLENYSILSSRQINGEWVPNAFMPPLYPLFLFIIKKIFFFIPNLYIKVILFCQLFLYFLSIKFFKKILIEIFKDNQIVNLGNLIFLFFPIYIYSIGQISSIILQIFLLILFIYNFVKFYKYNRLSNLIVFSIVSGLLILLRGEFFVFFFFTLLFLIIKKKKFILIFSLVISLIVISPYLIRNYLIFDTFVLTKSTGFNLLKGNNPKSRVEGIVMWYGYDVVPDLEEDLKSVKPIYKYDLISDKIFLNKAISYLKQDPLHYIILYFKKFFSFLFIDFESTYPNYYSFLNILPKILISMTTLVSIYIFFSLKINLFNYFSLIYFFHAFIFSFFFILPRYNLIVLPFQIILSLFLYEKYLNKNKKNVFKK